MSSLKDRLKAGLEVMGAVARTAGRRLVGNEEPVKLSPETNQVLDELERKNNPSKAGKDAGKKAGEMAGKRL